MWQLEPKKGATASRQRTLVGSGIHWLGFRSFPQRFRIGSGAKGCRGISQLINKGRALKSALQEKFGFLVTDRHR